MFLRTVLTALTAASCILFGACSSTANKQASVTETKRFSLEDVPLVSVQLHSVRDSVQSDFEATLKAIAAMGFDGVELAGRYGPYHDDADGLKAFLDGLGLAVSGAHIGMKQLTSGDALKHFAFFKALDTELVIIPHDPRIDNPEKIDEFIKEVLPFSKMANELGLKLGYHNHAKEFKAFNDTTFWDHLAQNTPEEFVLQLDVGWVNYAGADPIEYVKRYPNRTLTTHYKVRTKEGESGTPVTIGEDAFDWKKLIETNIEYGATQWLVIEQEEYPEGLSAIEAVAKSKQGLDRIIQSFGE